MMISPALRRPTQIARNFGIKLGRQTVFREQHHDVCNLLGYPRYPSRQTEHCFSSNSSGGGADNDNLVLENDKSPPTTEGDEELAAYFPWRHESDLPARFDAKDDLSGMPNNFRARFVRRLVSCKELNLSTFEALPIPFFARQWEEELAENFKMAFSAAMEELLFSIYRGVVPVNTDGGIISIDSSQRIAGSEDANLLVNNEYLSRMMDKDLIAKYQSFNADKSHLKLRILPMEANLENIFAVPLLSREIVEMKPHLRGAYQRIEKAFTDKASFGEIKKMTYDLAEEIGDENASTRTVFADASIVCSEFYQVKDAQSGTVIQGMEDEQEDEEVIHNIRFEVVTEKNDEDDGKKRKVGNWKIIDIDDLLDGNVFH